MSWMRRFSYFYLILSKVHVILGGSYHMHKEARWSSDWLEDHRRVWKHRSHYDYMLY